MAVEIKRVEPVTPLLRCPFDGGPPILELEFNREFARPDEIGVVDAYVWCHECGARGPHCDTYAFDDSDLREVNRAASLAWNKAPRQSHVTVTAPRE